MRRHGNRSVGKIIPLIAAGLLLAAGPLVGAAEAHGKVDRKGPAWAHGGRHDRGLHLGHWKRARHVPVFPPEPVYRDAPYLIVEGSPHYWNASLGVWIGGVRVGVELGDPAPVGVAYRDPYCGATFPSLTAYRVHAARHGHHPVVRVVDAGACRWR